MAATTTNTTNKHQSPCARFIVRVATSAKRMDLKSKAAFILMLLMAVSAVSCGKIKEKAKEGVNKGGETVGKAATEFFEGVSEGVDKTLQCTVVLSSELQSKGVGTGKFSIHNLTKEDKNNLLTLYLIFEKDFNSTIAVKVLDKNGLETGRTELKIQTSSGTAAYYDFAFDKRTHIEAKSKIHLSEK